MNPPGPGLGRSSNGRLVSRTGSPPAIRSARSAVRLRAKRYPFFRRARPVFPERVCACPDTRTISGSRCSASRQKPPRYLVARHDACVSDPDPPAETDRAWRESAAVMVRGAAERSDRKIRRATSFVRAPGEGLWRNGGGTERDTIVVVEVMAERLQTDYWRALRELLEKELAQEEIVIRAQEFIPL